MCTGTPTSLNYKVQNTSKHSIFRKTDFLTGLRFSPPFHNFMPDIWASKALVLRLLTVHVRYVTEMRDRKTVRYGGCEDGPAKNLGNRTRLHRIIHQDGSSPRGQPLRQQAAGRPRAPGASAAAPKAAEGRIYESGSESGQPIPALSRFRTSSRLPSLRGFTRGGSRGSGYGNPFPLQEGQLRWRPRFRPAAVPAAAESER
jgi:hypothetical protein